MPDINHFPSKHFVVQEITNSTYAFIAKDGGAAISNAGIVDLGGQVVVFDTFLTPQAAEDLRLFAEERFGQKPTIVVNSHYHNDHIWGNQVFQPDAVIISSAETRTLITTAGMEEFNWYSANAAQELGSFRSQFESSKDESERNQLLMWIGYYEGLVEAIPHLTVCLPEIVFKNRLDIFGEFNAAQLITFDGAHTGSDTILYLPQEGVIYMSDLLFVGCHPYLADGDPVQLLKTLQLLGQMDAETFVPGHGPVGTKNDLKLLINYIEGCFDQSQALVNKGGDIETALPDLVIRDQFNHWQLPQFFNANVRFLCKYLDSAGDSGKMD